MSQVCSMGGRWSDIPYPEDSKSYKSNDGWGDKKATVEPINTDDTSTRESFHRIEVKLAEMSGRVSQISPVQINTNNNSGGQNLPEINKLEVLLEKATDTIEKLSARITELETQGGMIAIGFLPSSTRTRLPMVGSTRSTRLLRVSSTSLQPASISCVAVLWSWSLRLRSRPSSRSSERSWARWIRLLKKPFPLRQPGSSQSPC